MDSALTYLAAGLLGALIGVVELVTRYRDDPTRAVLSAPAFLYVAVNGGASLGALALIHVFDWRFGLSLTDGTELEVTRLMVAGLGSAALFRSSLLNVASGDQTIGIGPNAILTVLTTSADRAVDRRRARVRSEYVGRIMREVPFERAAESMPIYAWGAMQNVSTVELERVNNIINSLRSTNSAVPDRVKSYVLGFALLDVLGENVLEEVAKRLREDLAASTTSS